LGEECRTLSSSFCSFLVEVTQSNYKCWQQISFILHDQKILRTLWWMFCTTITITVIITITIIIMTALVYLHTGSTAPMSTRQEIRVLCNTEAPSCLRAGWRDTEFACVPWGTVQYMSLSLHDTKRVAMATQKWVLIYIAKLHTSLSATYVVRHI
jgi:hypothetical protein